VLWCLLISTLLISCNSSGSSEQVKKPDTPVKFNTDNPKLPDINADSVALTKLIRNVYEWHETNHAGSNFSLIGKSPTDTVFTGINWPVYNKEFEEIRKTNFFAQEFLDRHRAIAATIDSSVKKAGIEWRNFNDGIPLWSTNADDWCGCQDYPDNYWKRIDIHHLKVNNDIATFNWAWGKKDGIDPPFTYNMRAKKENGAWKISYMDGFSYYGTVADYDKRMNAK
jgi:hypothetical protein